jgi:hypothetical protein
VQRLPGERYHNRPVNLGAPEGIPEDGVWGLLPGNAAVGKKRPSLPNFRSCLNAVLIRLYQYFTFLVANRTSALGWVGENGILGKI